MIKKALLFLLIGWHGLSVAQTQDSLLRVFQNKSLPDSLRLKAIGDLAWDYAYKNVDSAIYYARQELAYAKEKGLYRWQIDAHNTLGYANQTGGNLPKAIGHYKIAEALARKSNDTRGVATAYNNIGIVHYRQGNLAVAIQYYLKGLAIFEKINDLNAMANTYNNVGTIYREMLELEKAADYFDRAYKIFEKIKDNRGISMVTNNLGMIQSAKKNYAGAIAYFKKSIKIKTELKDAYGMINGYLNMGSSYMALHDLDSSGIVYAKGLELANTLHDTHGFSLLCSNMGELESEKQNYKKAAEWCHKGLLAARKSGVLAEVKANCSCLYTAYEGLRDYKKSLHYYTRFVDVRDSISNQEKFKDITRREMQFNFDKKETADSVRNRQREKLHAAEIKARNSQIAQDQVLRYSLAVVLGLVIFFTIFIYNRLKLTRKQNEIISEQKEMVTEKNREILDSINYSKRIQESILPTETEIARLLPEAFVLFKPKDIVSGDFYFVEPIRTNEGKTWIGFAAADSTGHGVPGAFMSILGTNILKQSLASNEVNSPSEALNFLNHHLHISLRQNSRSQNIQDGMDIAFCVLNPETKQLYFAGANNPVWIFKSNGKKEFIEIQGDKQPIGFFENQQPFNNHSIQLSAGDMVYVFTDGFADQFGGPGGKKFKYKKLKECLVNISHLKAKEQLAAMEKTFEDWKKGFEQTDDVCVVGVRV
ncbi:MAG: tetratricopeptide repeat protein [Flavobacteriales bacterium]